MDKKPSYVMLKDGVHLYWDHARSTLCERDKVYAPPVPWAPANTVCRHCLAVVGEVAMNGKAT